MNPLLRWTGGKRRLASKILAHVPSDAFLAEPFAGSAALTFARPARAPGWINDANEDLIAFYRMLQTYPDSLHGSVLHLYDRFSGSVKGYAEARDWYNQGQRDSWHVALFYFLNKHSYSGLYRVNRRGQYNTPYGQSPKKAPSLATFQAASKRLGEVLISLGSYRDMLSRPGDVIYLDPPYEGTNFAGYTAAGQIDHAELRDWADRQVKSGCKVLVSGLLDETTRERWRDYSVADLGTLRHTVRKGGHVKVTEALYWMDGR